MNENNFTKLSLLNINHLNIKNVIIFNNTGKTDTKR